jgi:hypothetical protein
MRQRLLHRHVLELVRGAPAKRPAAGRDRQPLDRPRWLSRDQLVQSRVLGIDGEDASAGSFCQRDHELAPHDERLLVRKRQIDPLAKRRDRGPEAGGANEPVEHEIGARLHDQAHEPGRPRKNLAVGPSLGGTGGHVLVGERDSIHAVGARLLHERLPGALRGQSHQLELLAVCAYL